MPCPHHTQPVDVKECLKGRLRKASTLRPRMDLASVAQTISEIEAIYVKASSPSFTEDTFPGCTDEYVERMLDRKLADEFEKLDRQGKFKQAMKLLKKHPDYLLGHMRITKNIHSYSLLGYPAFQAAYGARL